MEALVKTLMLALALTLVGADAQAISRYNTEGMTCSEVQAVLRNEGAAILRYRSKRTGARLYGRYVYTSHFCDISQYADWRYVPTADVASCPVKQCEYYDRDDPFIRHR